MLTWLARRSRPYFAVVLVFLVVMIVLNTAQLVIAADMQAKREAGSQERVEEALNAVIRGAARSVGAGVGCGSLVGSRSAWVRLALAL